MRLEATPALSLLVIVDSLSLRCHRLTTSKKHLTSLFERLVNRHRRRSAPSDSNTLVSDKAYAFTLVRGYAQGAIAQVN
jgi:hypothetical protein